jgi:RNA polymerase sigma-70 factor (ECF subfamily)
MDCADLISRARQGDHQAFAEMYTLHKRRVYSLCLRMTHNVEEAEDLTQEAFTQVFLKLHTFRGESAFSTWLHRVTVNIVLMRLRKRKVNEYSLDDMTDPTGQNEFSLLRTEDNLLSRSVDRLTIEEALNELPPGYRLIFVLHDILGYEHQEIAEILGCSSGNCKSQLHKARQKLRKVILRAEMPSELEKAA